MDKLSNAVSPFLNQNLYGFLILLIAAFFFYEKNNEAGQPFLYIGAALMGFSRPQPSAGATINAEKMDNTSIVEPKV
jgi:hypothetical protein